MQSRKSFSLKTKLEETEHFNCFISTAKPLEVYNHKLQRIDSIQRKKSHKTDNDWFKNE